MELRCDGEIASFLEFEGLFGAAVTLVVQFECSTPYSWYTLTIKLQPCQEDS